MMLLEGIVTRYVAEMITKKHVFEKRTINRMATDEALIHEFFVKVWFSGK